jgi:hypothetical protein
LFSLSWYSLRINGVEKRDHIRSSRSGLRHHPARMISNRDADPKNVKNSTARALRVDIIDSRIAGMLFFKTIGRPLQIKRETLN